MPDSGDALGRVVAVEVPEQMPVAKQVPQMVHDLPSSQLLPVLPAVGMQPQVERSQVPQGLTQLAGQDPEHEDCSLVPSESSA